LPITITPITIAATATNTEIPTITQTYAGVDADEEVEAVEVPGSVARNSSPPTMFSKTSSSSPSA